MLAQGFDDLVTWVRTGHRPAGHAIMDRRTVAADFGCRFTLTDRASFGAACPARTLPPPDPAAAGPGGRPISSTRRSWA
ncbi:hypothetical protein ACFPIJ_22225 [Dactylosporangium cerinum]|uniref:Uncharacterized protein n=1 Tax=Dactylosporangium cerinum TaxID=1434730 RepID=A0ABV9VVV4_9ACTN